MYSRSIHNLLRYSYWPILLFGFGTLVVTLVAQGAHPLGLVGVLALAIGFSFLVERILPYQTNWNASQNDRWRDVLHASVNLTLSRTMVLLLPLLAWLNLADSVWPKNWPFALQVILAVLILDLGIAAAHHASHKLNLLWRLHAVHHSVKRMYGFNGLMKHPLHQLLETSAGVLPLLLLGIPYEVALTLPFLVTLALLGQHTNVDIRTGWLKYLFANAEVHRFHHSNGPNGDVNFGLFTTLYDHLAGTFYHASGHVPRHSDQLGLRGRADYPATYLAQLREPFRSD